MWCDGLLPALHVPRLRPGLQALCLSRLSVDGPLHHTPDPLGVRSGLDLLKAVLCQDLLHLGGLSDTHLKEEGPPQPQGIFPLGRDETVEIQAVCAAVTPADAISARQASALSFTPNCDSVTPRSSTRLRSVAESRPDSTATRTPFSSRSFMPRPSRTWKRFRHSPVTS